MSRIPIKLARHFRTLRGHCESDDAVYGVELVDDCIDQWEVVFRYPEHSATAVIKLRFLFSLTEELPPKVTVLEPKTVPYVCYAELGSTGWSSDSDIVTLTLCLREELFIRHSSDLSSGSTERYTPEEAQEKWKFVKDSHSDWNLPDISELNTQLAEDVLEDARKEARREYLLAQENSQPPSREDEVADQNQDMQPNNGIDAKHGQQEEEKAAREENNVQEEERKDLEVPDLFDGMPQLHPKVEAHEAKAFSRKCDVLIPAEHAPQQESARV